MTRPSNPRSKGTNSSARLSLRLWDGTGTMLLNLLVLTVVVVYLFPMSYMFVTALKENTQFSDIKSPIWPVQKVTFGYQSSEYPVYKVPTEQGIQQWALVTKHRKESEFVDPANPEAGLIHWEGQWRTLEPVYEFKPQFSNFATLWQRMRFTKLLRNTIVVTILGEIGVLASSILVAYGFARFPIPGGNVLFIILIATIIIPEKVTLIPTYFIFVRALEWNGTWLPLIVPHFFGNALLIFLMRQNFKSIPRDLEEAAMLAGAGPVRILISVILPQSMPVIVTAALLHFFYAWNETRMASLYLGINPDLYTIAFGVQRYQNYFPPPNMLQASALMAMVIPVAVLFLVQRVFMQDVLVTGLEK